MKLWLIVAASLLSLVSGKRADLCQDLDIGTMGEEKEMDGCVLHQENDFRLPGFDFSKLKVRDGGDWEIFFCERCSSLGWGRYQAVRRKTSF